MFVFLAVYLFEQELGDRYCVLFSLRIEFIKKKSSYCRFRMENISSCGKMSGWFISGMLSGGPFTGRSPFGEFFFDQTHSRL